MDEPMLDSEQMNQRLDEMVKKLEQSAVERHTVNGKVHVALNSIAQKTETLTQKTENQDVVLNHLSKSVEQITQSVRRIEVRLVGDEDLKGTGIIQEQSDQKARITALEVRVDNTEEAVKEHRSDYISDKRALIWIGATIAGLGAIITWLQNSGFLHKIFG